jgi:hypothetical protein
MNKVLVVGGDSQIYTDCMIHGRHRTKNRLHDTTSRTKTDMDKQAACKKREGYHIVIVIYKHILLLFPQTNML